MNLSTVYTIDLNAVSIIQFSSPNSAVRNNNAALMKNSKHSVQCTNTETLNYSFDHSIIKQIVCLQHRKSINYTTESLLFIWLYQYSYYIFLMYMYKYIHTLRNSIYQKCSFHIVISHNHTYPLDMLINI